MKTSKALFLFLLSLFCAIHSGSAQQSFQNLDFESATFVPIPGDIANRISFDHAFPGWRGYVGGMQETAAVSNGIFLCCSAVTLFTQSPTLIEGGFTAGLHAALDPYGDPQDSRPADTSIAQTGLVPVGSQSLLVKAQIFGAGGTVTLGGEPLSLIPVSTGSNYVWYGADVSAWAGQELELRFTALSSDDPRSQGTIFLLDSIEFSTTPIPEPSTFALLAVAGAIGWFYCRRRRR